MATYINIPEEYRQMTLEQSKVSVINELYRACLNSGIDPETLDMENPSSNTVFAALKADTENHESVMASARLEKLCAAYLIITSKN